MSATLVQRVLAFGVDYLLISVYLAVLTIVSASLLTPELTNSLFGDPAKGQLSAFVILTLPVLGYFALTESSPRGASPGKRRLGLRVETSDHQGVTLTRALARNALKLFPWELAHTVLWRVPGWPLEPREPEWPVYMGFAGVWILVGIYAFGATRLGGSRTLYDRLTGCRVVRIETEKR